MSTSTTARASRSTVCGHTPTSTASSFCPTTSCSRPSYAPSASAAAVQSLRAWWRVARSHLSRPSRLVFARGSVVAQGGAGVLKYQDTSTGKLVATHKTKLGPCSVLRQNPYNAVLHCGHNNGARILPAPPRPPPRARRSSTPNPVHPPQPRPAPTCAPYIHSSPALILLNRAPLLRNGHAVVAVHVHAARQDAVPPRARPRHGH